MKSYPKYISANASPCPHFYADGTPVFEEQEPNRLPSSSRPLPDANATGPHSQLRWDIINNRIYQAREFDASGSPLDLP